MASDLTEIGQRMYDALSGIADVHASHDDGCMDDESWETIMTAMRAWEQRP